MASLEEFPAGRAEHLHAPVALAARGVGLRPAGAQDLPFLRHLYGQTRAAELAAVPWPAAAKERFLDDQFALQHRHYLSQFASADFLLIEHVGEPAGRLYLWHDAAAYLIVDVSLLDALRGRGIGTHLLGAVLARAAAEHRDVQLHVDPHNVDAQRLYLRLGFEWMPTEGAYRRMRWTAPIALS